MTITNDTNEITIEQDGIRRSFTKRNCVLVRNGSFFTIRDFEGTPITFLFSDVTSPASANSTVLLQTLRAYLNS